MSTIRREAVATDPLAQFSAHQKAPPPPPLSTDRMDYGSAVPIRAAPITAQSPEESAEGMVKIFASKCRKLPIDPKAVPANLNGLQILARSNAWRHVVELFNRVNDSQTESSISQATKLRIEGLFRLKMFDDLSFETSTLLAAERSRLLLQSNEEEAMKSSNNIYAMQLLLSEVKAMTGNGEDAFQDLYQLREELDNLIPKNSSSSLVSSPQWWSWRLTSSIINTAIRQRLWRMALSELTGLLCSMRDRHEFICSLESSSSTKDSLHSFRKVEIVILCRLSRLLLQIGAMKASLIYFNEATEALEVLTADLTDIADKKDVSSQVELTRGLMLFGQDQYEEATEIFSIIIERERGTRVTPASDTQSIFDAGPIDGPSLCWRSEDSSSIAFTFDSVVTLEESVLSAAVNNYAVCALYLRRIHEAINRLEDLVKDDPLCHLIDPIVFNLCTLYDLSCSPDISVLRKMVLQKLSVKYNVDDPMLHWRSFRLN